MDKRDFERESRNHSRKIDITKGLHHGQCHSYLIDIVMMEAFFVVMQSVCGTFHILYDPAF